MVPVGQEMPVETSSLTSTSIWSDGSPGSSAMQTMTLPPNEFRPFSRLPTELRLKICSFSFPYTKNAPFAEALGAGVGRELHYVVSRLLAASGSRSSHSKLQVYSILIPCREDRIIR